MIGWRGRIGAIVPATNVNCEYELNKMVPEGISVHAARIFVHEVTDPKEKEEQILKLGEGIKKAAKDVAQVNPGIIAFCCTSGSFLGGKDHAKEIIDTIETETKIPAITTTTAVLGAFKKFNLKRIALATPYNEEIAEKEVQFFEEVIPGFKIVAMKNLGIVSGIRKGDLYPSSAYIAAREVDTPEAEAIFISCTAWNSIEVIELLEKDLKKPIITSNQATMWGILKKMGISGLEGYGRLLREL